MSLSRFIIAPLRQQDRTGFRCGVEPLDRYFQTQVGQDMRRGLTACFVAEVRETGRIAGFYTLAAAEVPVTDLSSEVTRRLPRYPTVAVARIGRLSVDAGFRGCKLGSVLLTSAASRAAASDIAVFALVVDAIDEQASAFYSHHGFVTYASQPTPLIAPIQSLIRQ